MLAAITPALLIIGGVRGRDAFDLGNVLTWLLVAGFAGALLGIAVFHARMGKAASSTIRGRRCL